MGLSEGRKGNTEAVEGAEKRRREEEKKRAKTARIFLCDFAPLHLCVYSPEQPGSPCAVST